MNIFGKTREQLLFELIERHNNISLNRTYAYLTNFVNSTGTTGVDATIDVESNDPTYYYNMKRLNYGKADLNDQLKLQSLKLRMIDGDTSWTLLAQFNKKYGVQLTTDDIILSQIDKSTNPWTITFRAKPDSWVYKTNAAGLVFTRDLSENQLSVPLKVLQLSGLTPPSTDLSRLQGPLMTYPANTQNTGPVSRYVVGYTFQIPSQDDWAVADILTSTTGEQWNLQQAGYTLYNYKVAFNGLTTAAQTAGYHVNTEYTRVLVLTCGNLGVVGGYVVIHY